MNSSLRLYLSHQCVCRRLISGLTDEKYPCQNNSKNDKSQRSTPFTAAQSQSTKAVREESSLKKKRKGDQANNGLGFWAGLYLHLVYSAPVCGESREVERLEISCKMTNNPFVLNNKSNHQNQNQNSSDLKCNS